jgi:hypothetical protein|eukprot:evm.model.NODE_21537_length_6841_cov_15.598889.1
MEMETPLPGLNEEEGIDVYDGDESELGNMEEAAAAAMANMAPEQKKFMESLQNIMVELSEPCKKEFATLIQAGGMDKASEVCQAEISAAAAKVPDFARQQEAAVQAAADKARRANGRQPDPNAGKYLAVMLVLAFLGVVAYIVWVNRKLKEAGMMDKRRKQLSKKKLEKAKMREQQKKKIM